MMKNERNIVRVLAERFRGIGDWLLPMQMNRQVKVMDESEEMGMAADVAREEYNAIRKT